VRTAPGPPSAGAGEARLRLFCALRLREETVAQVGVWQERWLRGGRLVPAGNLHLTLAFLGSRPATAVAAVAEALGAAAARTGDVRLVLRGYRETRSVGMLRFDDERGEAGALAARLADSLEALGLARPAARAWSPHLTVLRFAARPRLEPPLPELGVVSPSDAAVYSSALRPDGARYEVLEAMALGG
jgi:RNA 2',3'-cyclic 3'-phosphodiesterase